MEGEELGLKWPEDASSSSSRRTVEKMQSLKRHIRPEEHLSTSTRCLMYPHSIHPVNPNLSKPNPTRTLSALNLESSSTISSASTRMNEKQQKRLYNLSISYRKKRMVD